MPDSPSRPFATRSALVALATLVAALLAAGTTSAPRADAAVTLPVSFRAAEVLGSGHSVRTAVDDAGRVLAVWRRTTADSELVWHELTTTGAWTAPVVIPGSANASNPEVAVSPNGHAIIAWEGFDNYVRAVIRPAGAASFGAAQQLGSRPSTADENRRVAVDIGNNGDAIVAWEHVDDDPNPSGTSYSIEAALARGGTTFGAHQLLGGTGNVDSAVPDEVHAYEPKATIDGSGNAVVIFQRDNFASEQEVLQALAPAGAGFGAATVVDLEAVGADGATHYPSIDSSQSGQLIAAWSGTCGPLETCTDNEYLAGFTGTTTGGLTPGSKQRLSNPGSASPKLPTQPDVVGEGYYPQARVDEAGRGIVVFEMEPDGDRDELWGAANLAGSAFGSSFKVETGVKDSFALDLRLTDLRDGVALLSWTDQRAGDAARRVYVSQGTHPALAGGGTWSAAAAVGPVGSENSTIALSLANIAVVGWTRDDDGTAGITTNVPLQPAPTPPTQPNPPADPTPPVDVTAPVPGLPIANVLLRMDRLGRVPYAITCPRAETRCVGTVTLSTMRRVRARLVRVTIGTKAFSITGGNRASVLVPLTRAGRGFVPLDTRRSLTSRAAVTVRDTAGNSRTINRALRIRR